jgi:hypothetical protein
MSPDMNPIEHVWDFIGRKINQCNPKCQNIACQLTHDCRNGGLRVERAHCHGIFGLSDYHQECTSPTYSQRKYNPGQLHPHPQKQLCPKCGPEMKCISLHHQGMRARWPIKRPQLTLRHRHARFNWAHDHLRWTIRTWRRICTIRALCGLALSSMNISLSANAWLSKWGTTRVHCHGIFGLSDYHQERKSPTPKNGLGLLCEAWRGVLQNFTISAVDILVTDFDALHIRTIDAFKSS